MSNEIIELIDKQALIKHLNTTMYRDVMEEIKNFPSVTPVIAIPQGENKSLNWLDRCDDDYLSDN